MTLRTGVGDDPVGIWLQQRASWAAQAAAAGVLAVVVWQTARTGHGGVDNQVVVRAARTLLDGGSPYADRRFLYLPSSAVLGVPEALAGAGAVRVLGPVVVALLVLAGWQAALRLFGVPARSRLGVAGVAALAYFAPFRSDLVLGNWTAVSAAALPVALLLAARGRWTAAAAVVGAAVACKPMLVPLVLLFAFARRWRALAVLVAVPLGASLAAALAMPHPGLIVTRTLPFLMHGQDAYARPYDASLTTILPRLGLPQLLAAAVAALLAAAGLVLAWYRWRCGGDQRLRLAETAAMLMLATFLLARPAFLHYALLVLPVLVASLPLRASAARSPWLWIVLLPQNTAISWPYLETDERRAFKDAVILTGLAALLAARIAAGKDRPDPVGEPATARPDSTAPHPATYPRGAAGPPHSVNDPHGN